MIGNGKWLLKEGAEFAIRFLDGAVAEVGDHVKVDTETHKYLGKEATR